jgi:uncharacterized protein YegL
MRKFIEVGASVLWLTSACASPPVAAPPRNPTALQVAAAPVATPALPSKAPAQIAVEPRAPKLEVVFVLDTTGSMAALIDGAKQKIWAIADELASAKPTPELRIGLIAYRDRGDAYVTRRFPLSDDIDTVYQQLYSLHADGGGDEPESVNQALREAVHDTTWSQDARTYRAVFLVGDARPHLDYQDDVPYSETVREAAERGIVINTVQCGDLHGTREIWAAIARGAQGTYASIQQDGGMLQIATPMDEDIGRLNAEISATVMPYGGSEQREGTRMKARAAAAAPVAASASRHAYLAKKGGGVVTGGGDLVDDLKSGRARVEGLKSEELPSELRGLSTEQQQVVLEKKGEQRKQLQSELDKLVRARAEYVQHEEKKRRAEGQAAGFDGEVMKAVKEQAARSVGVSYE